MHLTKIILGLILISAVIAFFALGLNEYLSLDYFNSQKADLFDFYGKHPLQVMAGFFLLYVIVTGLSLPGAALMTLGGGAIFGFWIGALLVSVASTIGATVACFVSRTLLKDWVQQRFGDRLAPVNKGVEEDGGFYLFSIRLVPVFPFFLVNLLMGLTPIKLSTFFFVSQLGMLPGTLVYVNAGKQLANINSVGQVMSPELLGSFVLLAAFPLLARKIMSAINFRREVE